MTAVNDDDFFDSDGDHDHHKPSSPYLKGAYDRGDTSPGTEAGHQRAAKTKSLTPSTSGNFSAKSSDSDMSDKRGESKSHHRYAGDDSARSRSPSPYSQSPAYSDSFNSEDSEQDSRRASPERSRRDRSGKPKGKPRGASTNRFNSGTSYDSRSTYKNSARGGSTYGNTNRTNNKGSQKTSQKKPGAANNGNAAHRRSNSTTSSQASPRNANEVSRRMLSAKGHTISRLRNEFNQLQTAHDELDRENKLLKALQRRQERALSKYDSEESELPQLLKKHSAELDSMRRRIRKYQERDKDKDRRMKDKDEQHLRTEDELKRLRGLAEDKGLLERHDLQKRVGRLEDRLAERDKKVSELESYIKHMKKNQKKELRDKHGKEEDVRGQLQVLENENERLQMQIKEKEKELEVWNIYSHRLIKPPGKLRPNPSPNSLKVIMVSKSTSTADQPKVPHPPPQERQQRERSAEEVRRREETAARVKSPKEVPAQKEDKIEEKQPPEPPRELSEHEKILRDLDMGWEKKSDPADRRQKQEDDRRRAQQEEERRKREEEERQQQKELEEMRKQEEEERRRRKEEQDAKAKRQREEQEKPTVYKRPSFFGPKPDAPSNQYNPSLLDSNPATKPKLSFGKSAESSDSYKPSFFSSPTTKSPERSEPKPTLASPTHDASENKSSSFKSRPFGFFGDDEEEDFFGAKQPTTKTPPWLPGKSDTSEVEKERKSNEAALLNVNNSPNDDDNDEEEEENVPFFGSKPKAQASKSTGTKSPTFAVNSVRGLHKYSRGDSGDVSKRGRDEAGAGNFGRGKDSHSNSADEQKEAEERRKKDLLLARMQEIDDGGKPDSGKNRKNYNFTKPVENLHNGVPSHPDDGAAASGGGKGKKEDPLAFGSYAPTFSSSQAKPKPKRKSFFDDDDDDGDDVDDPFSKPKPASKQAPAANKKSDLMANLFETDGAGEDKAARSSFNDDKNMFTSSTKAKPVSYPWEKKVDTGADNRRDGPGASKAQGNLHDSLDDIDDLEEVIL